MHAHYMSSIRSAAIAACLLTGLLFAVPELHANEVGIDVSEPSWVGKTLEHHMGKRVKLRLRSGQEIEGTVSKVGAHAVHVSQLAGMDFFDAAVRLGDISAVIVKARSK